MKNYIKTAWDWIVKQFDKSPLKISISIEFDEDEQIKDKTKDDEKPNI